jgi:hypothetical protein
MRLGEEQQEEIIAELAGHLEDVYESSLEQGICAEKAEEQAWREVSSGRELARRIRFAKQGEDEMSNFTRQVWLPALVTSLVGTGLLAFFQQLGMRPIVLRVPSEISVTLYLPWLLSLPLLGFLGAFWSRREGAAIRTRIIAGIFLSLIYFAVPWLILPVALVVDPHTPKMVPFAWFLLNWAVLPCIALLVGALPAAMSAREGSVASRNAA